MKNKKIIKTRVKLLQVGDVIKICHTIQVKVKEITDKYVYFEDFDGGIIIEDGRSHISWFYVDNNRELRLKKIESKYNNSFREHTLITFKMDKNGDSI